MFHNCFDGTLPKIQTFLTGQGVQGAQHRSPVLAELLPAMLDIYPPKKPCRVWGCLCCEFTFLPAGPCQNKDIFVCLFYFYLESWHCPAQLHWCGPLTIWAFGLDLDGDPRSHCAPQTHPRPPELRALSSATLQARQGQGWAGMGQE